jgi:hypothetical protein
VDSDGDLRDTTSAAEDEDLVDPPPLFKFPKLEAGGGRFSYSEKLINTTDTDWIVFMSSLRVNAAIPCSSRASRNSTLSITFQRPMRVVVPPHSLVQASNSLLAVHLNKKGKTERIMLHALWTVTRITPSKSLVMVQEANKTGFCAPTGTAASASTAAAASPFIFKKPKKKTEDLSPRTVWKAKHDLAQITKSNFRKAESILDLEQTRELLMRCCPVEFKQGKQDVDEQTRMSTTSQIGDVCQAHYRLQNAEALKQRCLAVDVRLEKVAVSMVIKPASNGKFTPARWVLGHFKQVVDREFATRKAEIVQTINTGKSGDQLALHWQDWQVIQNTRDHLAHVGIQDNTAWIEVLRPKEAL